MRRLPLSCLPFPRDGLEKMDTMRLTIYKFNKAQTTNADCQIYTNQFPSMVFGQVVQEASPRGLRSANKHLPGPILTATRAQVRSTLALAQAACPLSPVLV